MCKYCEQISDEQDLPEFQVHAIISRFLELREADGLFTLSIAPECRDMFDEFDEEDTP